MEKLARTQHAPGPCFIGVGQSSQGRIALEDILVVAPYNFQVMKLKEALGQRAKVGTVDKFQGQEAQIVIVSMCASNAESSPRGVSFLLSTNRLNVAISRARALAIVVGCPDLGSTYVGSAEAMKLVNGFCKIMLQKVGQRGSQLAA